MNEARNEWIFAGIVKDGRGKFAKRIRIPGRNNLKFCAEDWPTKLCPGTLNIYVTERPDSFEKLGLSRGMRKFDEGVWRPEFVIPAHNIRKNTKGDGQVWRARLQTGDGRNARKINCWMLRRKGSGLNDEIELVSELHLRETLELKTDCPVTVTVFEGRRR